MVPVTVYTLPNCVQCDQTKKMFTRLGVQYDEVRIDEQPELAKELMDQGYTQAPIVKTDVKTWSGFRIDKIQSLANYVKSQEDKRHTNDTRQHAENSTL